MKTLETATEAFIKTNICNLKLPQNEENTKMEAAKISCRQIIKRNAAFGNVTAL